MGALTHYYVDPAIAADSGAGTIGDPYGDLQWALNQITRDSTNGDQINVKSGTDEILSSALSFASYGAPSGIAPLVIRGYTSVADDGGVGGVSGNGSVAIVNTSTLDSLILRDMHLHNCGAATIVTFRDFCQVIGCELDNTSGGGISMRDFCDVVNCNIHNIGGVGVSGEAGSVSMCYFKDGTNTFTRCVDWTANNHIKLTNYNIISLTGNGAGIRHAGRTTGGDELDQALHNSLFSTGSTPGDGIEFLTDVGAGVSPGGIINNLIEGFGTGINLSAVTSRSQTAVLGNSAFDCTTEFSLGDLQTSLGNNETLGATPYEKSGADTYANRREYFAPVDTGDVLTPYAEHFGARGAIQGSFFQAGGGIRPIGIGGLAT